MDETIRLQRSPNRRSSDRPDEPLLPGLLAGEVRSAQLSFQ